MTLFNLCLTGLGLYFVNVGATAGGLVCLGIGLWGLYRD